MESQGFCFACLATFDALDDLAFRICSALRYEIYERETERSRLRSLEEQTNEELMGQAGHILLNSRRADYERSHSSRVSSFASLKVLATNERIGRPPTKRVKGRSKTGGMEISINGETRGD